MSFNPWSLPKDKELRAALLKVAHRLGGDGFALSPLRCDHPGAVVLCKPDQPEVQAYLYTFGQEPGYFGLQLEYPQFADTPPSAPSVHENLTLHRVAELLRIHFDLA